MPQYTCAESMAKPHGYVWFDASVVGVPPTLGTFCIEPVEGVLPQFVQ